MCKGLQGKLESQFRTDFENKNELFNYKVIMNYIAVKSP